MFVLLDEREICVDVCLLPMLLSQERLAQNIESHGFLKRQASKNFVALMVFTEGSYCPQVRALHVGEHKHLDLLSNCHCGAVPQCAELITQLFEGCLYGVSGA
jgi:hypothetical protein